MAKKILKAVQEKKAVLYKGNPLYCPEILPEKALQDKKLWKEIFKILKEKTISQK